MSSMNLQGQPGELRMTIEVKRAATGKVDTFELVGHADPEKLKQILESENERNAQHSGT